MSPALVRHRAVQLGLGQGTSPTCAPCAPCPSPGMPSWFWALVGAGAGWGATMVGQDYLKMRKRERRKR